MEGGNTQGREEKGLRGHRPNMESRNKKNLTRQMSLKDLSREAVWDRRRRMHALRIDPIGRPMPTGSKSGELVAVDVPCCGEGGGGLGRMRSITDGDLDELRGSIELGFGFNEEDGGHQLCDTLPALDLYFAVERQFSMSPASTPTATSSSSQSPKSPIQFGRSDSWKLLQPGDAPQLVKTKLRHWAQAVACSVKQK